VVNFSNKGEKMKVLLSWLSEYVNIDLSAKELADKLTNTGLEVEGIDYIGKNLNEIIVGEITEITKNENSKNLFICKVKIGDSEKTIVTAATNVFKNAKVPVALPGTKLPNGLLIKEATLQGVVSEGMLCSTVELQLASYATGVLILDSDAIAGSRLNTIINDVVFDIGITPNRADCLSVKGIAREIAAITNQKLKDKNFELREIEEKASDKIKIEIDNYEKCPRYIGKVIKDVEIKPAPFYMRLRLELSGVRSINNIVDVTNYALLELGHPLHAFDYDTLKGNKIIVRTAKQNETITTIDDEERKLNETDLVIADSEIPVAVAGVMGGKFTEVSENTKTIMLESAYFLPSSIRQTSKNLKLSSEASYRFERGTDIDKLKYAADYATYLIAETSGGKICKGTVDTNNGFDKYREVKLNIPNVKKVLGIDVPKKDIIKFFELLEFSVSEEEDNLLKVKVPTHRNDIEREIDLIEEVARIYGFDKIEATNPVCDLTYGWKTDYDILIDNIKTNLAFKGFKEIITYSFSSEEETELYNKRDTLLLKEAGEFLKIDNPISTDASIMRPTLLFNMLNTLKLNSHIKNNGMAFFEEGKVFGEINKKEKLSEEYVDKEILKYGKSDNLPFEKEFIGMIISNPLIEENWFKNKSSSSSSPSFFLLKAYVEQLLNELNFKDIKFAENNFSQFQKGQSAEIYINNILVGLIGKVHPDISIHYDISESVYFAELNFDILINLYNEKPVMFKSFSKYPAVERDIAVVIKDDFSYNEIKNAIDNLQFDLLEKFEVIDVYKGKPIEEGYKNIAITFTYRSNKKTLGEEDINEIHQKIFDTLVKNFEATTR
jgi:phenylalanyl-tRNA synthetase beta chain